MSNSPIPPFEQVDGMTGEEAFAAGYKELENRPQAGEPLTVRLDPDVAAYFGLKGAQCEAAVNKALRAFIAAEGKKGE